MTDPESEVPFEGPSATDSAAARSAATPPVRIGRSSTILAIGTLISRILGFVSAAVLAQTIGLQAAGDAFKLANMLPNNVYAIIAGGLLTAVLVPQIVRASVQKDGGERFVNGLLTLGILVFALAAGLATLAAPLLVRLFATTGDEGFSEAQLTLAVSFAYWCLPQIFFYALFSLLGEVLNARGVFGPFSWAPVLNNLIMIAGLFVFQGLYGQVTQVGSGQWSGQMIALLGGAATLGIAGQALVLFLFWRRAGLRFRPSVRWRGIGLRRVGQSAGWIFAMILVTQTAGIFESRVATIPSGDYPSVAVLNNAWLMAMLPHSIIVVSIATAYFTQMSAHARDADTPAVRDDLASSVRSILLFLIFSVGALAVIALPFSAIFASEYDQMVGLAQAFWATLVALLPFSLVFLLQRVLFALEDTRTAFLLQAGRAVLFIALSFVVALLPPSIIVVGLCLAGALTIWLQAIAAGSILRRRLGGIGGRAILRQALWFAAAFVPAGGAGVGILFALGGFGPNSFAVSSVGAAIVSIAASGVGMLVVYVTVLALTRNPELRAVAAPVLRRLPGIARR